MKLHIIAALDISGSTISSASYTTPSAQSNKSIGNPGFLRIEKTQGVIWSIKRYKDTAGQRRICMKYNEPATNGVLAWFQLPHYCPGKDQSLREDMVDPKSQMKKWKWPAQC